jgi:hypothetical protein
MSSKASVCGLGLIIGAKGEKRINPLGRRCGLPAVVVITSTVCPENEPTAVCQDHYEFVAARDRDVRRQSLPDTLDLLDEGGKLFSIPYRIFSKA